MDKRHETTKNRQKLWMQALVPPTRRPLSFGQPEGATENGIRDRGACTSVTGPGRRRRSRGLGSRHRTVGPAGSFGSFVCLASALSNALAASLIQREPDRLCQTLWIEREFCSYRQCGRHTRGGRTLMGLTALAVPLRRSRRAYDPSAAERTLNSPRPIGQRKAQSWILLACGAYDRLVRQASSSRM